MGLSPHVFCLLPPCDVANDAAIECSLPGLPGGDRQLQGKLLPVFPQSVEFDRCPNHLGFARCSQSLHSFAMRVSISGGHKEGDRLAYHLRLLVTEHVLCGSVPDNYVAKAVAHDNGIGG